MSLIKWNQPPKLAARRNWIENFFAETDDFFKDWNWDMESSVPAVNVREEKNAFLIDVAAPGMKKDDFRIDIENGILMIRSTSEDRKEETADDYRRQEFSFKQFKRSFWLPENVDAEKISATYEDGLLKLILPKMTTVLTAKSKTIQVV